jgi:cytochrome bd ubiquinol oxidase subunit II
MAQAVLVMLWVGISAYALLAGADFGAGLWDLLAGNARRGADQRALIEHSIGPVWEANHVWLIFALVVLWTGFPKAFSAVTSTLWIPLTCAALGVIMRGSAFAFRKTAAEQRLRRAFGAAFAGSSVVTPYFFGAIAGGVASGRVPPGVAAGSPIASWVNPISILGGFLAIGSCAYLAAVYLTGDARRAGSPDLAGAFRLRGLITGVLLGGLAFGGIFILHADAPRLYAGLTGRALPLVVASALLGVISLVLLWYRQYALVRLTAAAAVVCILWGWAAAQYPYLLLPRLTISAGSAPPATLEALIAGLSVGAALFLPPLGWLFFLFQRRAPFRMPPDPARTVDAAR